MTIQVTDPRCKDWVSVKTCPSTKKWELTGFVYQDETESGDNHNIYYTLLNRDGTPASNIACWMTWPPSPPDPNKASVISDTQGEGNLPIYGNSFDPKRGPGPYNAFVESLDDSDEVVGMGLPLNRHVCFKLTFQWTEGATPPPPPPPVATGKLGIGYPNVGNPHMQHFFDYQWSGITLLHFQLGALPQLRAQYPNALLLVRAYLDNWYTMNPEAWADQIVGWATAYRQYTVHWTFANEQNLRSEGHPNAALVNPTHYANLSAMQIDYPPAQVYVDICNWNLRVINRLRAQAPWIVIHSPALSQGHSDDENDAGYVGYELMRAAVEACDYLDIHTYWTTGLWNNPFYGTRYDKPHALFPNMKGYFLSECGTINMNGDEALAWLNGLPSWISGGPCWFIWDSDAVNAAWILYLKQNMLEAFMQYQNQTPAPNVEQAAQTAALARTWMPININAALYKFAQLPKNNLGYPQTDEFEFMSGSDTYVGQVYNLGIAYVKKGDWGNCQWVKKP